MCVAWPGKVVSLPDGKRAVVDFDGNQVTARRGLVDVAVGDRVLVHAGCILQKVGEREAEEMKDLFQEIGTLP